MKLFLFFLTITIMQVSASSYAQKITLNVKNEPLEKVFNTIRTQSGYDFFYDLNLIKKTNPITINVKGASIEDVLNLCFKNQPLIYKLEDKAVMIREKNHPLSNQKAAKNIVGVIIDADTREPIPGVSVKNNATNRAIVSGENGRYSISANPEDLLVFSYLGYATESQKVGNRTVINIALKPNENALNEVVVVGYGTVKRGDLTGSVGSVSMADLEKAPVQSFDQALAGRVAGVNVTSGDDQPGSGMNIVIRGAGSLTQSTAPLYVIDGFPIEDFDAKSLNPDDIESINVLKDASSTAIFGARGANGVIVVQTKQGYEGLPTISYSGRMGISQANKRMEMMNPYEFVKYELERSPGIATQVFFRDLYDENESNIATVDDLERYRGIKGVDWQDKILQDGSTGIHSLSLRGGTKQTRYSASGSIFNQGGSIVNSGSNRYQGKAALIQTVNPKLNVGIDINYSFNKSYGQVASLGATSVASSTLFYSAWGYRPVMGIRASDVEEWDIEDDLYDSSIDQTADYRINPLLSVSNELRERYTTNFRANGWFTYNITKDLVFKAQGGVDNVLDKSKIFYNSKTHRGTTDRPGNTAGVNGAVSYSERGVYSNDNTLTWKHIFDKKNRIDIVGGFSLQSTNGEGFGLGSQNIPNEELGVWGLNEGVPRPNSSRYILSTMVATFGRVNYAYNNRYLFTATYRADASSKFREPWAYFPSGAVAWRISREPFMKKLKFISDAKLRASYGKTGNNRVGDFSSEAALGMPFDGSYSFNNTTPILGIRQTNMENSDLRWETTAQTDLGLDLSLFKNKISLTVDVYRKTTSDLLLNANVPFVTGFRTAFKNIGKVQNDGLEITLQTTNVRTKKFSWTSNFNISFNKNKILALTDDEQFMLSSVAWDSGFSDFPYIARVGESAATFFGTVWDGNYGYEDFDVTPGGVYTLKPGLPTNSADVNVKPKPGDIKYRDINGDGIINGDDRVNIGRPLPIHIGGFSNTFQYKGIDLNVFFQWSYGNDILNVNKAFFEGNQASRILLNQFASYEDRWTPENQSSTNFRVNGGGPNGVYSSRLIEDGSFIRLKTIALGYTIPSKITSKVKLNKVRLSASGQNLVTWSNYSGMDPEVSVRHSILTPGLDWSSYPRMRTFVFGAQITF